AVNWLRLAFDRIAEPDLKAGGKKIDADALSAFVGDAKRQGPARRLALDTLERVRKGARGQFLKGALEDAEFRVDAIEQALEELDADKDATKEARIVGYR